MSYYMGVCLPHFLQQFSLRPSVVPYSKNPSFLLLSLNGHFPKIFSHTFQYPTNIISPVVSSFSAKIFVWNVLNIFILNNAILLCWIIVLISISQHQFSVITVHSYQNVLLLLHAIVQSTHWLFMFACISEYLFCYCLFSYFTTLIFINYIELTW